MNLVNLLKGLLNLQKKIDIKILPSQGLFYKDDFEITIKKADVEDIILNFIRHDDEFDDLFANPDVPDDRKKYHDKKYAKYLAESNPTELVEPTKTFEQFLINKNFINI